MRAGRLHRRIRIDRKVVARHATLNSDTTTWTPRYQNVPAGIEPLRGGERVAAGQRQAETTVRVVFHYLPDIARTDRVVDEESGEVYEIAEDLDPSTRHRILELLCTRGLTDG